jgi:hypothetical protein
MRRHPDPVYLGLSSLDVAPQSHELRADFARLALAHFAATRGAYRLQGVLLASDENTLKSILLVLTDAVWEGHERALKEAAPLLGNEEFARLAELASDILDWDCWDDAERCARAWPVLCDELEYELEHRCYVDDGTVTLAIPWALDRELERADWKSQFSKRATANECRALAKRDRRWGR